MKTVYLLCAPSQVSASLPRTSLAKWQWTEPRQSCCHTGAKERGSEGVCWRQYPGASARWALFQWQNKWVIWQNIQQWSCLIIVFTTLLFSLLWCKRPLSSALSFPRMTHKKWLYLCLRFPCPPLGKSLSFGDLNVVIVHLTSPFAYYPNILWRCWFYDFLVHLLLELDFYSQKKFKFFFTKSL